jgi:hypothetical protein
VKFLRENLGVTLTALLASVDPRTVARWVAGGVVPREEAEKKLRSAFQIFHLLAEQEAPATVRAWFMGMNEQLADLSPAEVLSAFRRAPSARIHFNPDADVGFMNQGSLPANWRNLRSILRITCVEPLPFLELENPKTLVYLDAMLAKELNEFGFHSPFDVSMIRGSDRRITRAIFEETDVEIVDTREIKVSDPDLSAIAALYQLTIH